MQNRTKYTEQKPKIKLLADGRLDLLLYNVLVCPCQRQTQTRSTSHAIRCLTKLLIFPAVFAQNSNHKRAHKLLTNQQDPAKMRLDANTTLQQTTMSRNVYFTSVLHTSQRDKFHPPFSTAQIVYPATSAGISSGPRRHSAPICSTASASRLVGWTLFTHSKGV
jgi:hypothetical protein